MSGNRLNKAGFVLLASLMMTTALPAFAQTEVGNAPLPEVEVDGSVLQQLDPSAGATQSLTPIQLTPPSVTRQATSNSGPTLISDMDPSGTQDVAIKDDPVKDTSSNTSPSILTPPERVVAKAIVPDDAPLTQIETHSVQAVSTPPVETQPVQNIAAQKVVEPATAKEARSDDNGESFLHHFVTAPVKSLFGSSKKSEPVLADIPAPPVPAMAAISKSDQIPAQASVTRAGMVSQRPTDLADETRPAIIPQKKASKPVEVAVAKPAPKIDLSPVSTIVAAPVKPVAAAPLPAPDANIVTQVVMDVPNAQVPTAPLKPVAKVITPPVKPVVTAVKDEGKDLVEPPKVMAEAEGIKAPVAKPVLFPVSTKSKTRGEINPQITKADSKTPIAPVLPRPDTKQALNTAMFDDSVAKPQQVAIDVPAPKQATPEIIYRNVPVPKPRPNVVVASKDFVEQARRTYEDTYKVIKRDGDQMPAISAQKVAKEDLSAPANMTGRKDTGPVRMSVADIATDPLASKLVAMTPDDIASTLNSMAPAAGGNPARADMMVTPSANRVRIVRENGNWVPRKPAQVASADAGQTTVASLPADGRFNLAFQSNATDLPSASYGEMDNGVVNALRADSNARVQILAYASAADGKDTTAKRTSLARALSIRSYMISKGIDATRVDVRAMGLQQDAKAAPDQVQMIVVPADAKKS